jgi:hypothetical protein
VLVDHRDQVEVQDQADFGAMDHQDQVEVQDQAD